MLPRPLFESVSHDLCCLLLGALQDPTFFFHSMTANIICSIVFGKRFGYKDPEFLRLMNLFYVSFALISSFSSQVREREWEGGHEVDIWGKAEGQSALGAQKCTYRLEEEQRQQGGTGTLSAE